MERRKIIRLTQVTGLLVERALIALAAEPTREKLIEVICGHRTSALRTPLCFNCMGKANIIMRLYPGAEMDPAERR